jgi:hypothetical protein
MPEPEDLTPRGLHVPASDPAAPAVEALRALASQGPVAASAELAAFLDEPAGQGLGTTSPQRSDLVTVVRLPIRRAGGVAGAGGAALALAPIGGVAGAATGGAPDREPAQVQQDDPSDTTTTTEASETETSTAAPEHTVGDDQDGDAQGEDAEDSGEDSGEAGAATHTPNATAYANHHDGVGSDDEHADVNGGGSVDHRAEHSPSAHPTKADGGDDADEGDDDSGDDQGDEAGDDSGDSGEQAPASQHGGGSNRH